jgi:hypothetical protein
LLAERLKNEHPRPGRVAIVNTLIKEAKATIEADAMSPFIGIIDELKVTPAQLSNDGGTEFGSLLTDGWAS